MRFSPKTQVEIDQEIAKFAAWPRGSYDFEIAGAIDDVSKNGNEMIVLDLVIYNSHGDKKKLKDYLVEAMPVKFRHLCHAVGLHDAYEGGIVAAHDFIGRTGKVTLQIEKKDPYPEKNVVQDYVPAERSSASQASARPAAAARQKAPAGGGDLDDEIPF